MKTLIEKVVKAALLLAVPATFIIVAYLLHNQPKPELISDDISIDADDTNLQQNDSVNFSKTQADINKELDSIARYSTGNLLKIFSTDFDPDSLQNIPAVQNNKTPASRKGALHGPSALFTRTYSLLIGKPVPVNVLWAFDSVSSPVNHQLVTITLSDVANDKAAFTLADPSAVLLYSKANYAENDEISIEDENHNLHISVLQVQPDSVKIQLISYLNDDIVSRLKQSE